MYFTLELIFLSKVRYSETLSYCDLIVQYVLFPLYETGTEFRMLLSSVFHGPNICLFW